MNNVNVLCPLLQKILLPSSTTATIYYYHYLYATARNAMIHVKLSNKPIILERIVNLISSFTMWKTDFRSTMAFSPSIK